MEDPVLNKSLEESKELQARWNQFREYIRVAIERRTATPQAEMKFLELKSIIAMLHDGFMAKLDHDQKTGQSIMSIVGDCIMLRRIANYTEGDKQKFELDWNACYMLISEQVQALVTEKQRLAGISERAWKASKRHELFMAKAYKFMHSDGLRWTLCGLGLLVVLYAVPTFFWSYRNLKKYPGVNKLYFFVADGFYRPFIDSDYEYDYPSDLPSRGVASHARVDSSDSSNLTKQYFKSSVLNQLGMTTQGSTEAAKLFDSSVDYQVEAFNVEGRIVNFYYVLFPKTKDAQRFVAICKEGLQAFPDASKRSAILDATYVLRSANFIAIGIGSGRSDFRSKHILEKYDLKDVNALQ
jgi:hypothetical protein